MTPLITLDKVQAGYGDLPVVHGVTLRVEPGEIVALLGPNGAGKTTLLRVIAGQIPLMAGELLLDGKPARGPMQKRVCQGFAYVPEERSIATKLTTADNLRLGRGSVRDAVSIFPVLEQLLRRRAGLLSGGEQQMLTLARALAGRPRALIIDELSLGLAPVAVKPLFLQLRRSADQGAGIVLVEQAIRGALSIADRAYVLRQGRVVMSGTAAELGDRDAEIEASYL